MKNQNNVFTSHTGLRLHLHLRQSLKAGTAPRRWACIPDPISGLVFATVAVITVHSTDNVTRGKTGSFVLVRALGKVAEEDMKPALIVELYVNFKVSGTAIAAVDYVLLVSPAFIGRSGYRLIQVKTLPDQKGSAFRQALSVIITLEPGAGYAIGATSSATMWIKPALQSSNQSSN